MFMLPYDLFHRLYSCSHHVPLAFMLLITFSHAMVAYGMKVMEIMHNTRNTRIRGLFGACVLYVIPHVYFALSCTVIPQYKKERVVCF